MSKAEELETLRRFAASLPAGSYLAGWLLAVLPTIEADMRGDIFPSVTPAETRALCADLEKQATERAAELVHRGELAAAARLRACDDECKAKIARVRERCAALVRAVRSVSSAADSVLDAETKLKI